VLRITQHAPRTTNTRVNLLMKDVKARVISNKNITGNYFKIKIDAPFIAKQAKPGQFVMVKCSDGIEPFLRRPLSIHRLSVIGNRLSVVELLYEVVGKGTGILAEKKSGDALQVLGPLGNGFFLPSTINHKPSTIFLIAGGIGVAPLLFLAETLSSIQHQASSIKIIALIGAKTKTMVLCEKDFKKIGAEVHIATDDGTYGRKGFVTELFKDLLQSTINHKLSTIYVCGPEPMLKVISAITNKEKILCQVSLETKMACGIGACLGCIVKMKDGTNKLACKDGPVFNANELTG
jgi:dihydroorotate dehydrogenase electron transfer subunit